MRTTITPKIAREILATSDTNYRRLDQKRVAAYAKAMENNQWEYNGETIKFNLEGKLVDGQHRLSACIVSGVSFDTERVNGIESTWEVDRGKARKLSDELSRLGYENTVMLCAALGWIYKYAISENIPAHGTRLSTSTGLSIAERVYPAFVMAKNAIPKPLRIGAITSTCTMSLIADTEVASMFWVKVDRGCDLDASDPAFVLREKIMSAALNRIKTPAVIQMAFAIKAWNAAYIGQPTKVLRWSAKERFPELIGMTHGQAFDAFVSGSERHKKIENRITR